MKCIVQSLSSFAFLLVFLGCYHPLFADPISRQELATKKVYTSFTEALKEPDEVYRLDLSGLELKEIPRVIVRLVNLQELDLSHNSLSEISAAVAVLRNLEYVDLGYNNFKSIPATLGQLENLKHLNLKGNKISSFGNAQIGLNRLEALDLGGNELVAISFSKNELPQLSYLNLEGNQLRSLPDFSPLDKLQSLDLGHNELTSEIFLKLGQNTKLKHLLLNNNALQNLDELKTANVSGLRALEYLDLSANSLTAVPAEITKLAALKRLDLDHNKISSLPRELKILGSLNQLGISDNEFSAFPEAVLDIPMLSSLSLGENKLTEIPEGINRLSKLKNLYLNGTAIRGISPGFTQLAALDTLDVEGATFSPEELLQVYLVNSYAAIYYHDPYVKESFFLKKLDSDDTDYMKQLKEGCKSGNAQSCFDLAENTRRYGLNEVSDFYYTQTVQRAEKEGHLSFEAQLASAELLEKRLVEPKYLDKDDLNYSSLLSDPVFTAYKNICELSTADSKAAEVQLLANTKCSDIISSQLRIYKSAISQYSRDVERIASSKAASATGYADAVKGEMEKKLKISQLNSKIDKLKQACEVLEQELTKYIEKAE